MDDATGSTCGSAANRKGGGPRLCRSSSSNERCRSSGGHRLLPSPPWRPSASPASANPRSRGRVCWPSRRRGLSAPRWPSSPSPPWSVGWAPLAAPSPPAPRCRDRARRHHPPGHDHGIASHRNHHRPHRGRPNGRRTPPVRHGSPALAEFETRAGSDPMQAKSLPVDVDPHRRDWPAGE